MKLKLSELKRIIKEEIKTSASYKPKEDIKNELQSNILAKVSSGEITSDEQLKTYIAFLGTETNDPIAKMALGTLKMIPLGIFKQLKKVS